MVMQIILVYLYANKFSHLKRQLSPHPKEIQFCKDLQFISVFLIHKYLCYFTFSLNYLYLLPGALINNEINKIFNMCSFCICMRVMILTFQNVFNDLCYQLMVKRNKYFLWVLPLNNESLGYDSIYKWEYNLSESHFVSSPSTENNISPRNSCSD